MTTTAAVNDLTSIGTLASYAHRTPRQIESAANKLGIVPAWRVNCVRHFDANQVDRIMKFFAETESH